AALGDWPAADEVRLGIALDGWRPTRGTRRTVQRNSGRHIVLTNGRFEPFPGTPLEATWAFAPPLGAVLKCRLDPFQRVALQRDGVCVHLCLSIGRAH